MTNFFTSDHHFFHKNIINLCHRPFEDLKEMHEQLIKKWNKVVKKKDVVFYLGDFSFGNQEQTLGIIRKLNGHIFLIKGNHDKKSNNKFFYAVWDNERFFYQEWELRSFSFILDPPKICFSHYPYSYTDDELEPSLNKIKNGHIRYTQDEGLWLLHGHVHQQWKTWTEKRMINVGVDVWDYTPIHQDIIYDLVGYK
jgi:calcineurin-like phosphoesterase family protein